jgi:dTDP-4-amino-4,6-dideoxygalactose transaminase
LPYLEAIDARCWYSNYGSLVNRLEDQLARHFKLDGVVTTANATLGLTAALLAQRAPAASLCLMPSWTFAATPHAARAAGMTPWFHDVERHTWALDPSEVLETLPRISGKIGAVIVVSPFGAPIDMQGWQAFEDRTGIPVVVDAAAGFDTVQTSHIPSIVSLHATKILGAGEGGFLVTTNPQLRDRFRACCNFGFLESRTAVTPALNAKMSEYHAAVALASLAAWPGTRAQHVRIMDWYKNGVRGLTGVALSPGYGNGWVSGTTSVLLPQGSMAQTSGRLLQSGIDCRKWWGEGCHVQPAFRDCPHGKLDITEKLGAEVLGLPHFPDMQKQDVDLVFETLAQALSSHSLECLAEKITATQHY